jgi:hypothetical protein
MYAKEIGHESVDWIQMTQDSVQWRVLGNAVIKLSQKGFLD